MNESDDFTYRWLALGAKVREIYSLPNNIPWPDGMAPPTGDDYFINITALGMAAEVAGRENDDWGGVAEFCKICEAASGHMENFEYEEALSLLAEAEEAHGCAFVHWQRCICHLELRQAEQALAAAYHATSLAPRCSVFWRVYGELCQERGADEEATRAFEKAFFGGEHSPSVIAAMKGAGLLVPSPGGDGDMLVSPSVAGSIFKTHIFSVLSKDNNRHRLRELAEGALANKSTSPVALLATSNLIKGRGVEAYDKLLHIEALAKSDMKKEASGPLRDLLKTAARDFLKKNAERLVGLLKTIPNTDFESLSNAILREGDVDDKVARMIFDNWDDNRLTEFVKNNKSGIATLVLSERVWRKRKKDQAVDLALLAASFDNRASSKIGAAKVLLECGEFEKVCATISKVSEIDRGGEGHFIFGEALWRMGFGEQAGDHFSRVLAGEREHGDDGLYYNAQMRSAQCQGLLIPLTEPTTLSPTKRLGRAILVSNPHWTSVIAPAGLPSSSYIRIRIEKDTVPCPYRIVEISRLNGEALLGNFDPQGKHDEICLAVESSGRVFVGAKYKGEWVNSFCHRDEDVD
jgi:tetratricopeptide (TPR) repeat protein